MPRRKGKNNSKQDDSLLLLEPSVEHSRGMNEYVLPVSLFFIIAIGGSTVGWFCSQQQQTIDSLSETLASMQTRITKLQQQLGTGKTQLTSVGDFEERLLALEEAYAKAQRQAEVALAASQQIKSKDLHSKVWALQTEMNSRLAELQKNTISIASLNAIIKNQSSEMESMKQSVTNILSANSELTISISGLTDTLSVTKSRLDEQISVVDALMSQLQSQNREIIVIKESFHNNQETLNARAQELKNVKKLLELKQLKRAQVVDEQLKSLQKSLEDHQTSTTSLHSQLTTQLMAAQTQFLSGVQEPSRVEEVLSEKQADTDDKQATEEEPEHPKQDFAEELVAREEEEVTEHSITREEKEVTKDFRKRVEKEITEDLNKRKGREIAKDFSTREEEKITGELNAKDKEGVTADQEKGEGAFTEEQETKDEEELAEEQDITGEEAAIVTEEGEASEQEMERIQISSKDIGISMDNKEEDALEEQKKVNVVEEVQVSSEKTDMVTSETGKQTDETSAEEIQVPLEDSGLAASETEETAVDDQKKLEVAEKIQSLSEETGNVRNKHQETFAEKQVEHSIEEQTQTPPKDMHIENIEIREKEGENHHLEATGNNMHSPSDETDIATNETPKPDNKYEPAKQVPEESTKD